MTLRAVDKHEQIEGLPAFFDPRRTRRAIVSDVDRGRRRDLHGLASVGSAQARTDAKASAAEAKGYEEPAVTASERMAKALEEHNDRERGAAEAYETPFRISQEYMKSGRRWRVDLGGTETVHDVTMKWEPSDANVNLSRAVPSEMRVGDAVTFSWLKVMNGVTQLAFAARGGDLARQRCTRRGRRSHDADALAFMSPATCAALSAVFPLILVTMAIEHRRAIRLVRRRERLFKWIVEYSMMGALIGLVIRVIGVQIDGLATVWAIFVWVFVGFGVLGLGFMLVAIVEQDREDHADELRGEGCSVARRPDTASL